MGRLPEGQQATPPKFPWEVHIEPVGQQVPSDMAHCEEPDGQVPENPPPSAHPPTKVARSARALGDASLFARPFSAIAPEAEIERVRSIRMEVENIISTVPAMQFDFASAFILRS